MTLNALAEKCQVSRSMISLIERGESSPTAVVLEKIASGFGLALAALFDDLNVAPNPVSRREDRTPWRDPQSGYVRRNISPPNFPSIIRIAEVVFPAGAKVSFDTAPSESGIQQQIWMQEGSMEITVGHVTYRLSVDDCLAMELHEPVTFRNRARKRARYIVVVATNRFSPALRATGSA